ncbi:MAG: hypothetical protein R3E58_07465 [Phycisphaerae bacterium]
MLLTDEVPGCGTCKQFGTGPLSHPIVVDAAALFETAVVLQQCSGRGRSDSQEIQKSPRGDNHVVRFVDSSGKDLMARHADDYSTGQLLRSMVAALRATKQNVPPYLAALVETEYNPQSGDRHLRDALLLGGEQKLGKLDGVVATRIRMLDGLEVVGVDFDSTVLDYAAARPDRPRSRTALPRLRTDRCTRSKSPGISLVIW